MGIQLRLVGPRGRRIRGTHLRSMCLSRRPPRRRAVADEMGAHRDRGRPAARRRRSAGRPRTRRPARGVRLADRPHLPGVQRVESLGGLSRPHVPAVAGHLTDRPAGQRFVHRRTADARRSPADRDVHPPGDQRGPSALRQRLGLARDGRRDAGLERRRHRPAVPRQRGRLQACGRGGVRVRAAQSATGRTGGGPDGARRAGRQTGSRAVAPGVRSAPRRDQSPGADDRRTPAVPALARP